MADDADHRNAERRFQTFEIEAPAPRGQLVEHGQHDQGRATEMERFTDEGKRPRQRTRVHHHDERVGLRHALDSAGQHIAHDRLVGRDRLQPVGTGQVDQRRVASLENEFRLAPLDRDAWVVADPGVQTGERVEERGLARIRTAEEAEDAAVTAVFGKRVEGRRTHVRSAATVSSSSTSTRALSLRW